MRVTRASVTRVCAICERTLLMGEHALRFSPDGRAEYVDVCPLCQDLALEYGWLREGSPMSFTVPETPRRSHRLSLASILGRGRLRGPLRLVGPGFVAAIAYVDPGNFATNVSAGVWPRSAGAERQHRRQRRHRRSQITRP